MIALMRFSNMSLVCFVRPPGEVPHMSCSWFGLNSARTAAALCAVSCVLNAADPLETVQKSALELSRLQAEKVRLQSEWSWQRELMQSSLASLQEHLRQTEAQRVEVAKRVVSQEQGWRDVDASNVSGRKALDELSARIKIMSARLRDIRPWLPPRLSQALELPFRTLGDDSLPPGERLQCLLVMLNRCTQFNHGITFSEEIVTAEDGSSRLMEVLYWGLSHAYAFDRAKGHAYTGYPGAQGWEWQALPDAARHVEQLISTYQDKADPELIELPGQIRKPVGARP